MVGRRGENSSDYRSLREMFAGRIRDDDVMVDLGCSTGRVLATWLRHYPGHRVIGIEIDERVARRTARRFRKRSQCTVMWGDAVDLIPAGVTLVFMYNPFDRPTVIRLRDALATRPPACPPLRILYANPKHAAAFGTADWQADPITIGPGGIAAYCPFTVIDRRLASVPEEVSGPSAPQP